MQSPKAVYLLRLIYNSDKAMRGVNTFMGTELFYLFTVFIFVI